MAITTEKRTGSTPPVRIPERIELKLRRLAEREERSYSDYVARLLIRHVDGHGASLEPTHDEFNDSNAKHCDNSNRGRE